MDILRTISFYSTRAGNIYDNFLCVRTIDDIIQSAIGNNKISSWLELLQNDEMRNRLIEILGSNEKKSLIEIHSNAKKRLIDILKFPSQITIPNNVRFVGTINIDETTKYFSPKVLDRAHIVRFENPLVSINILKDNYTDLIDDNLKKYKLLPVYFKPNEFHERTQYPQFDDSSLADITKDMLYVHNKFLIPLEVDFGFRAIRQSLNYFKNCKALFDSIDQWQLFCFNTILIQKVFPKFLFDAKEIVSDEKTKLDVVEEFYNYLKSEKEEILDLQGGLVSTEVFASAYLLAMIEKAKTSNGVVNYWSIGSKNLQHLNTEKVNKVENIIEDKIEDNLPF